MRPMKVEAIFDLVGCLENRKHLPLLLDFPSLLMAEFTRTLLMILLRKEESLLAKELQEGWESCQPSRRLLWLAIAGIGGQCRAKPLGLDIALRT